MGAIAGTGPYVAQAPLAIVVAIQRTKFSVADASRAIQSMIITAWSDGIGSNWVGFMGLDDVKPLLGMPKDGTFLRSSLSDTQLNRSAKVKRTGNRFRRSHIAAASASRSSRRWQSSWHPVYNGMVLHEYYFGNLQKHGTGNPSSDSVFVRAAQTSFGSYEENGFCRSRENAATRKAEEEFITS